MANSVCWYGYELRREGDHVLRRALDFEVEGKRKAKEDKEEAGCGRMCEGRIEKVRSTLPIKVECYH